MQQLVIYDTCRHTAPQTQHPERTGVLTGASTPISSSVYSLPVFIITTVSPLHTYMDTCTHSHYMDTCTHSHTCVYQYCYRFLQVTCKWHDGDSAKTQ